MNPLSSVDLAVVALYLAGSTAIGLWAGRNSSGPAEFMAAGGRIPAWAVGLSIFGTYVSSISFLAIPGKAYAKDWNPFVFSLAIPIAAWLAVRRFVPFYRRSGELSAYEHFEHRFGGWARLYAVFCYVLLQLARTGTILYLLALALAPLVGWSIESLIVVVGTVVVLYTCFGGMEAVIWTDVMQSVVLIGGAFACMAALLIGTPGGPGGVFAVAGEHHKFSLGSFGLELSKPTVWVMLLYGFFMNLQNFGIDQSYVQRYHTAKTDAEAERSVWLGALLYIPISAVFLFIGTGLFAFYHGRPEMLPSGTEFLPNGLAAKGDSVFPHFIATQLPIGVVGLVVAGIFAAAQSTVSSSLNCAATLLLCDVYRRFRKGAGDAESMHLLRGATVVVGALGTAAGVGMIRMGTSALDAWWQWGGVLTGGMLGLFLLGRLVPKAGGAAGGAGVLAGTAVVAWTTFSPKWEMVPVSLRSPFDPLLAIVFGAVAVVAVGGAISLVLPRRSDAEVPSSEEVAETSADEAKARI